MDGCTDKREWNEDCPVTDCRDYASYPLPGGCVMREMEREFNSTALAYQVFGYVREGGTGGHFVDLYIWDGALRPGRYRRFVLRDGYRLSGDDHHRT